jgi:hypothetical protein
MTDEQPIASETPVTDPGVDESVPTPSGDATPSGMASAAPGGIPTRWLVGGGIAVGSLAIAAVAFILLSSRPVPEALRYVLADSVAVAEVRMDLPGDQVQRVGNLLAHFPGFSDQSTLGAKIDEALGRLVTDASNGQVDYATKIKPWIAGPTFVSMGGPTAASSGAHRSGTLVVATTDGKATCEQVITGTSTHEALPQGSMLVSSDGDMACFLDGRFALIGDPDRIKLALDAHADGKGIDTLAAYRTARDALGGDRLATLWTGGDIAARLGGAPLPSVATEALKNIPAWTIAGIRAEDDALVADVVIGPPASGGDATAAAGTPGPTFVALPAPRKSDLAGFLPGDTLLVAEGHGAGAALQNGLLALRGDPAIGAQLGQLDAALELAGGPSGLLGWIDDAGLVILGNGQASSPQPTFSLPGGTAGPGSLPIDGGLILVAPDETTAAAKVSQLRTLFSLAALSNGGTSEDTIVDGTTITTIDLGDLNGLLQGAGAGSSLPIPSDFHASFSIAGRGKLVILGADETFARRLLQVEAGSTLADQAAYRHAVSRSMESNLAQVYLAAGAVIALAEPMIPADQVQRWTTDIKPYAAPLEAVMLTVTKDGQLTRLRFVLTVAPLGNQ